MKKITKPVQKPQPEIDLGQVSGGATEPPKIERGKGSGRGIIELELGPDLDCVVGGADKPKPHKPPPRPNGSQPTA